VEATQQKEGNRAGRANKPMVKKNRSTSKKKSKGKLKTKPAEQAGGDAEDVRAPEGAGGSDTQPRAYLGSRRMVTRHMGQKHVSMSAVSASTASDPPNYREAMQDALTDKWAVTV
jgi:hypothetical protein